MFDVAEIRKDFPMITNHPELIYFDNGATSFKPQCVLDALMEYYTTYNANIHRGDYDISFKATSVYDETRKIVRDFLHAEDEKEIVYTAGDTASLNIIAYGYGMKYLKEGDVILTTELEHASNILPWFTVAKATGARIEYIPLKEDGRFDLEAYKECLDKYPVKLVSLTYVSNVLGYINPVKEICRLAHEKGAIVNLDGAQAVPHIPCDVQDIGCDFLSFSSHKMCGPEGLGILYGKLSLLDSMDPLFQGGGANARFNCCGEVLLKDAPEKFEAGTPNISAVAAFGKTIAYLQHIGMENIESYERDLARYFIEKISVLDNVTLYNPQSDTGIVAFNVKGVFSQDAAGYFNKQHIAVRTGNHCAKMLVDILHTNDTIRASFYFYNTKEEIDRFVEVIKETTLEKCIEVFL